MTTYSVIGPVRVLACNAAEVLVLAPNGQTYLITNDHDWDLEVGQLVLMNTVQEPWLEPVEETAYPGLPNAGVVYFVAGDSVYIRWGDGAIRASRSPGLKVKRNWTVEFIPGGPVLRVLEKSGKRPHPKALDDDATSPKRFRNKPDKTWPDLVDFVGSPHVVRQARDLIELPFERRDLFDAIGGPMVKGVLFAGPPGTGKTMLAKIIAKNVRAQFWSVDGADIGDKWFGNSEKIVRNIFDAARRARRSIIFFDEIDAIAPSRQRRETHDVDRRVVSTLLAEMDGINSAKNVTVIATTNLPDSIDSALTRVGRFDRIITFAPPTLAERVQLMRRSASGLKGTGVDLDGINFAKHAADTDGWSGAELVGVWREAMYVAVRDRRGQIVEADYARGIELIHEQRVVRRRDEERQA